MEHSVPLDKLTKPCVAILGFTDHRVQAFNLDPERFELWGLNELHRYHPKEVAEGRFSRWFEVHPRDTLEPDPEHLKELGRMPCPVYMHQHWEDIPASVPFPKEVIERALDSKYFTSSIAWEIALAIVMGAEEIHVYGVDMAQDTEYAEQRNCCEYWLGVAKGAGIKTYVPPTADLLKCIGQYGFGETGSDFAAKLQERLAWLHEQDNDRLSNIRKLDAEYEQKRADLERQYQAHRGPMWDERNQILGAIQDTMFYQRSWAIKGAAPSANPSPDRSKDARTGIIQTPSGDSAPANRIAAEMAEVEAA